MTTKKSSLISVYEKRNRKFYRVQILSCKTKVVVAFEIIGLHDACERSNALYSHLITDLLRIPNGRHAV